MRIKKLENINNDIEDKNEAIEKIKEIEDVKSELKLMLRN